MVLSTRLYFRSWFYSPSNLQFWQFLNFFRAVQLLLLFSWLFYFCLFTLRLSLKMLQKITPIPIHFLRIISKNHKFTVQRIRKNEKRLNFGHNFLKNYFLNLSTKKGKYWNITEKIVVICLKENNSFCFDQRWSAA